MKQIILSIVTASTLLFTACPPTLGKRARLMLSADAVSP